MVASIGRSSMNAAVTIRVGKAQLLGAGDGPWRTSWLWDGKETGRVEGCVLPYGCWASTGSAMGRPEDVVRQARRWPARVESWYTGRVEGSGRQMGRARAGSVVNEGPSCIFVGPLESAEPSRLEALYEQARDSYYSGRPLILDDMFDRVEKKLRWHGSKMVLKYPRCSLRGYSAYADAEFDPSQMWTLVSIWGVLLASGVAVTFLPPACMLNKACQSAVVPHFMSHGMSMAVDGAKTGNLLFAISFGLMAGIPVSVAAVKALQGLWRGELLALKGCCPSCGEEVYAFIQSKEAQPRHKTECHVCEHPLIFHVNVERVDSHSGQPWAYGRIYLVTRSKDLVPHESSNSL